MPDSDSLLPTSTRAALPPIRATEQEQDPVAYAKLYAPWTRWWFWYVTEFDGQDTLFGMVSGEEIELGYFRLSELEAIRGPDDTKIRRDPLFEPKRLSEIRAELAQLWGGPIGTGKPAEYRANEQPLRRQFVGAADPVLLPAVSLVETRLALWPTAKSGEITTPQEAAAILYQMIGGADREHFAALYLNSRHRITHAQIVSRGTTQAALVHPREVFKAAVLANASAILVGHNHPTADLRPSDEDHAVFARLRTAGEILGIEVLDALIVGPTSRFYAASTDTISRLAEGHTPREAGRGTTREALEAACRGLLADIAQVIERQGDEWWGKTVSTGRRHRDLAERVLGMVPYRNADKTLD